ncbi:MAG: Protein translocase subunit SecE [Chlamydiae bacterium]|nr:Protein translocase subunit SecE [Chlamydiota bacterium]
MSSQLVEAKLKKARLAGKKKKGSRSFFGELKEELKKVSWTTKDELISSTKVVLLSIFLFGLGIYVVDLLVKGVLEGIKVSLRFIFG